MKYLIIFLFLLIPININALEINSSHAILYNMNEDMVLYEKDADTRTYIASLTKIMTTIVAIENIDDINESVTIPYEALEGLIEANASVAGFKLGQIVTYKDLLYGILLPSGADAARRRLRRPVPLAVPINQIYTLSNSNPPAKPGVLHRRV